MLRTRAGSFAGTAAQAVIASLLVALSSGMLAAGAGAKPLDKLDELIELVGLDKSFDNFAGSVKEGAKNTPPGVPNRDKFIAATDAAADAVFVPAKLKVDFSQALAGKIQPADIDALIKFYKTPLGVKITTMEKAANSPEVQTKIQQSADELHAMLKKDPARADVLNRINVAVKLSELSAALAFNMMRAMTYGMAAADEKATALPLDDINQNLEKQRPLIEARMAEVVSLSLAYTYREASVADLKKYLAFLMTPVSKRFYEALIPAMDKTYSKSGLEFGQAIVKELKRERI